MKLSKKFDRVLLITASIAVLMFFGCLIKFTQHNTFADTDSPVAISDSGEAKFVTFHDNGDKLTVKTEAKTVREALERAEIVINEGDIVDPGLDSPINVNDFFINIYRAHPAVVKDGVTEKYIMTASYDPKKVVEEAGLTVYDGDEVEMVANTNFLESGMANVYKLTRNGGRTLTVEEEIPFGEETTKDYNLEPEKQEVRQLGEVGMRKLTYNVLYKDNVEVSRELVSNEVVKEPVNRIVAVGATKIEQNPLTVGMGRNSYTYTKQDGTTVLRQETYYDLNMSVVIRTCGSSYTVRADGVKVDQDGYVLVAANLSRYPRCSVVETSLGPGKVYDTGGFAAGNPEQFDLATDWSNHDGV